MDIEQQKLQLERQRLAIDTWLKRREQEFQRQQYEASRKGFARWAQIVTPVGAAIVAGLAGLFGTVWNGYEGNRIETLKQRATERLERQKLEANLILDSIRTAGSGEEKEKQTAANLLFLAETGFITLPPDKLALVRAKAGNTLPSLPESGKPSAPGEEAPLEPTAEVPIPARHYRKASNREIVSIIVHDTGMNTTVQKMVDQFHTMPFNASTHYVIGDDGTIAKILDEQYVAIHSGQSIDPARFGNKNSIGVTLINDGMKEYPSRQVDALNVLLARLAKRYNIQVDNIVGHKESAPNRKDDPHLDMNRVRGAVRALLEHNVQ